MRVRSEEGALADPELADRAERKNWPNWVKTTLRWLAIAAALIGAVALVVGGIQKVWEGADKLCTAIGRCPAEAPTSAPPILPNLNTDWVDGGHSAAEYCNPQKVIYEKQYPSLNITMTELPYEMHKSLL